MQSLGVEVDAARESEGKPAFLTCTAKGAMLERPPTIAGAGHLSLRALHLKSPNSSLVTVAVRTLMTSSEPFCRMVDRSGALLPLLKCSGIEHASCAVRPGNSSRPGLTFMNFRKVIGFAPGFLQYKYPLNVASMKG